jgi:hypothetical protein
MSSNGQRHFVGQIAAVKSDALAADGQALARCSEEEDT